MEGSRKRRDTGLIPGSVEYYLMDDIIKSVGLTNGQNRGFGRRTLLRSVMDRFEALLWLMKCTILSKPGTLTTVAEDDGRSIAYESDVPLLDDIKFTLSAYRAAFNCDYRPDYSNRSWKCVQSAIALRHRLTHPWEPSDVEISDEALDSIHEAHLWLQATVKGLVESADDNLFVTKPSLADHPGGLNRQ